jgi:fumarylacetoacetase
LPAVRLSRSGAESLYWTFAQMVAHHTSNGCALDTGDLLGSGTISGSQPGTLGSLLEITAGGAQPMTLAQSDEHRTFLEDGDEIILRGRCERAGWTPIGFGECAARLLPAAPTNLPSPA